MKEHYIKFKTKLINVVQALVRCFSFKPIVSSRLSGHDKQRFMSELSTSESLMLTYLWIPEGVYWRRRCQDLDQCLDVSDHGHSYKRMCVEQNISRSLETFKPGTSDLADLKEVCEAVGSMVIMLSVSQLLTPTILVPAGHCLGGAAKESLPASGES